jgi:hypothetical protein
MEFLAWPAVGLILGIIALFMFKKPLTRLLDRTEKVTKEGLQARTAQEQQSDKPISRVDEFLKVHENQLLIETESNLKSNLDALHPRGPEEREKFLLRNFAALLIAQSFDKAYYLIYGSQLAALRYLNDNRSSALTTDHLRPFYDEGARKFQDIYAHYSFESWLSFLVAINLVQRNVNDVGLTIRGKEFLKYLIDQGYSFHKWG